MGDDPRKNLKWLEQELLEEEAPQVFAGEDDDLLSRVDALLEEPSAEEAPAGSFGSGSRGAKAERKHIARQFDESAAVLTKTKRQLRKEAKQRKIAEKRSAVNRNLKGLVFLALLEIIGILCILGWWLQ